MDQKNYHVNQVGEHNTQNNTVNVSEGTVVINDVGTILAAIQQNDSARQSIQQQLDVTQSALTNFFQILEREQVPTEKLAEALSLVAQRHKNALSRLAVLEVENTHQPMIAEARKNIENGAYGSAKELFSKVKNAEITAAKEAEKFLQAAQQAQQQRQISAAAMAEEIGDTCLIEWDYLGAADAYQEASDLLPHTQTQTYIDYQIKYADALHNHGDLKGDNRSLQTAIESLEKLTPTVDADNWNRVQENLGKCLRKLGEREPTTEKLIKSSQTFQAILEKNPKESDPHFWARMQIYLGLVYSAVR